MNQRIKKTFYTLVLFSMLAGIFGCATTTTVGLGYHVPFGPHGKAGIGFGIGF